MENFTAKSGFTGGFAKDNFFQTQSTSLWRPWDINKALTIKPNSETMERVSDTKQPKSLDIIHPVKLYWPKSRCFDYLYQDAEKLLQNYPVQATICLYEDSSSDEDSEDEEQDDEKELN